MNENKSQSKLEFSKTLLIQESILIWITTLAYIFLAFYCIKYQYLGTLPWLTAGVSLPWAAYGISQGFYYNKSKKENTKDGIKYELALREADSIQHSFIINNAGYDNIVTSVWTTDTDTSDIPINLNGPI